MVTTSCLRRSGDPKRVLAASLAVAITALSCCVFAVPSSSASPATGTEAGASLIATRFRLGTLGGASSVASAIDSGVVVGSSNVRTGDRHPFAYDLRAASPRMVDLAPGVTNPDEGVFMSATSMAWPYVVGPWDHDSKWGSSGWYADLRERPRQVHSIGMGTPVVGAHYAVGSQFIDDGRYSRPFALDLSARPPATASVSTLGEGSASALAMDETVVVGFSDVADGRRHPFAFDFASPHEPARDLGSLGGAEGWATAVDGDTAVGWSHTEEGTRHAFSFDIANTGSRMVDLGTLGGRDSEASAVDGRVIVGSADNAHGVSRAFVARVGAGAPSMVELRVPGVASVATDVDGRFVVGTFTRRDGTSHGFVHDLTTRQTRDLGRFPDPTSYMAAVPKVDGRLVTGANYSASGATQATVWRLKILK